MEIMKKIRAKQADPWDGPEVSIAFLGDSVTQGCFDVFWQKEGQIETFFDQMNGYHLDLQRLLAMLYPSVPISILHAGVSGSNAVHALTRLQRDVIDHRPDLAVVCFGLNDACLGQEEPVDAYVAALDEIFTRLQAAGIEVLFMTPNMMATECSPHLDPSFREIAGQVISAQTDGTLETYLEAAKALCRKRRIPVCDCYARWKLMERNGVHITELLSNHLNHPTRELYWLFAVSLLETMMQETP